MRKLSAVYIDVDDSVDQAADVIPYVYSRAALLAHAPVCLVRTMESIPKFEQYDLEDDIVATAEPTLDDLLEFMPWPNEGGVILLPFGGGLSRRAADSFSLKAWLTMSLNLMCNYSVGSLHLISACHENGKRDLREWKYRSRDDSLLPHVRPSDLEFHFTTLSVKGDDNGNVLGEYDDGSPSFSVPLAGLSASTNVLLNELNDFVYEGELSE